LLPSSDAANLTFAAVAGSGGTVDDFQNSGDYHPITRSQNFEKIRLLDETAVTVLPGMSSSAADVSDSEIESFDATVAGESQSFARVVEFGPTGEARIGNGPMPRWVQLAIAPANGEESNSAVIQISGLTGQVRIFRP
jgi:hypothetical protein